jgi:hypothetical protein
LSYWFSLHFALCRGSLALFGAVVLRIAARTVKELNILARVHAALAYQQLPIAFACCICFREGWHTDSRLTGLPAVLLEIEYLGSYLQDERFGHIDYYVASSMSEWAKTF